jgi:hypothetical protein
MAGYFVRTAVDRCSRHSWCLPAGRPARGAVRCAPIAWPSSSAASNPTRRGEAEMRDGRILRQGGARPQDGRGLRQVAVGECSRTSSPLRAHHLAFLVRDHPAAELDRRGFGHDDRNFVKRRSGPDGRKDSGMSEGFDLIAPGAGMRGGMPDTSSGRRPGRRTPGGFVCLQGPWGSTGRSACFRQTVLTAFIAPTGPSACSRRSRLRADRFVLLACGRPAAVPSGWNFGQGCRWGGTEGRSAR